MVVANSKQEAHLRIAIHDSGKYQLILFADLVGFDLCAGPHGARNLLRSSWHETGKVHVHTPAGRLIGAPRVMPEKFVGKSMLYSGGFTGTDWSYRPKPDSPSRRTLLIEKAQTERALNCVIWGVERGRDDLVNEVIAEYDGSKGLELVSHITVDWTQPQLVATVSTLTMAAWTSLNATKDKA